MLFKFQVMKRTYTASTDDDTGSDSDQPCQKKSKIDYALQERDQRQFKRSQKLLKTQCEALRPKEALMKNILVMCTNNHEEEPESEIGACLIQGCYQNKVDQVLNMGDDEHVTNHSNFEGHDENHRFTFGDLIDLEVEDDVAGGGEATVNVKCTLIVPEIDGPHPLVFTTTEAIREEFTSVDRYAQPGIYVPHSYTMVPDAKQRAQLQILAQKSQQESRARRSVITDLIYA